MRKCVILLALVNLLTMAELSAQQWQLEGYAGRIRSTLDPAAAGTESVMLGVRYDHLLTALRVSAGLPTSSDAPLWGALGASQRVAVRKGGLIAGVDLVGHGFLLHDRAEPAAAAREIPGLFGRPLEPMQELSGHAIAGQLMPVIGFEVRSLQAHVRAGASHYIAEFGDQQHTRTVTLADAQLTVLPSTKFALVPALRHLRADEGDYTYAGVTGILALGASSIWGSAGQWFNRDSARAWAAGASIKVHDRATLSAVARHDPDDPLYLNPAQTSWSVGAAIRLSRALPLTAPVPASYKGGRAVIRLKQRAANEALSIAGDFNNWKPQPMQRAGSDWTYSVAIQPGVYNYAFVDAQGEWFVPESHPGRKSDGMGGHVAVLVVQ